MNLEYQGPYYKAKIRNIPVYVTKKYWEENSEKIIKKITEDCKDAINYR